MEITDRMLSRPTRLRLLARPTLPEDEEHRRIPLIRPHIGTAPHRPLVRLRAIACPTTWEVVVAIVDKGGEERLGLEMLHRGPLGGDERFAVGALLARHSLQFFLQSPPDRLEVN